MFATLPRGPLLLFRLRGRRLLLAALVVLVAALSLPISGSAAKPVIEPYHMVVVDDPVATCYPGTPDEFTILSSYTIDGRAIVFEGTIDDPIYAQFHNRLVGTLTNSVTGKSLRDMAHDLDVLDVDAGTFRAVGLIYHTTVPGQGVVVAEVGLLVLDFTGGEPVATVIHGPHDVTESGVEAFCPYLA